MAGSFTAAKGATPATPSSGNSTVYPGTDGRWYTLDATGVSSAVGDYARYNWLHNGSLWFAQRQAPATLTTYSSTAGRAHGPDRWAFTNENASVQYIRVDTQAAPETGLAARYYGSVTKITANGKVQVTQCLEGVDTMPLRGRTVRVQMHMKATTALTVNMGLVQLNSAGTIDTIPATFISAHNGGGTDPTVGANLAYITPKSGVSGDGGTISGNKVPCSLTTSWARFGAVFDVPSNCKNLIVMVWSDQQITTTNGWSWSQATLVDGYEIQDYTPPSITDELDRCLRFYCKTHTIDTNPGANAGINTGEFKFMAGIVAAGAERSNSFHFPVEMRATPTVTIINPVVAATAQVRDETAGADCSASATAGITTKSLGITCTGAAGTTVGGLLGVHLTADASL